MVVSDLTACSGTFQISYTQLKYCPVEWTGVVVRYPPIDAKCAEKIAEFSKIYSAGDFPEHPLIENHPTALQAVDAASSDADIIYSFCQLEPALQIKPTLLTCQALALSEQASMNVMNSRKSTRFSAGCEASAAVLHALGIEEVPIVYNAADPDRIVPKLGRSRQRLKWRLKRNDIAIGVIGRHHWEKNPSAGIRCLPHLKENFKAIYLGDASHITPDLIHCSEYLAPGRVSFHPSVDEVGDVYLGIDVFLLASHREGMSIAMLEAMLAGVPMVLTRVGAVEELERKFGKFAITLDRDPSGKEIARAIRLALSPENSHLPARAKELANGPLSAKSCGENWARLFSETLKEIV